LTRGDQRGKICRKKPTPQSLHIRNARLGGESSPGLVRSKKSNLKTFGHLQGLAAQLSLANSVEKEYQITTAPHGEDRDSPSISTHRLAQYGTTTARKIPTKGGNSDRKISEIRGLVELCGESLEKRLEKSGEGDSITGSVSRQNWVVP